jgi:hypothetical protein
MRSEVSAPYLHVGLYDPDRDGEALREAVRVHLLLAGADVERSGTSWEVSAGTPLAAGGRRAWLEVLPAGGAGLVDVVVELADLVLEPPEARHDLMLAALDLVGGVRPVLATVAVEEPPDGLPDPGWPEASTLLVAGWVDPARGRRARRLRFERLAEGDVAVPYADGLAWGLDDVVRPGLPSRTAAVPPWVVAAAAYEAWTGHVAEVAQPGAPPRPDDDPAAAIPQLWWWSQAEDPRRRPRAGRGRTAGRRRLLGRPVRRAGLAGGDHEPRLGPRGRRPAPAARRRRRSPPVVGGRAAGRRARRPRHGPEPADDRRPHEPWVSRDWAGSELPELEAALAGTQPRGGRRRRALGDRPAPGRPPDESWADDDVRWDRLVAVAAILSRIAHRAGRPTA